MGLDLDRVRRLFRRRTRRDKVAIVLPKADEPVSADLTDSAPLEARAGSAEPPVRDSAGASPRTREAKPRRPVRAQTTDVRTERSKSSRDGVTPNPPISPRRSVSPRSGGSRL